MDEPAAPSPRAAPTAPAAASAVAAGAEALPLALKLEVLERKRGPRKERAEARVGGLIVLGGFVEGLAPDPMGNGHFTLSFTVRVEGKVISHYHGPVAAPYDRPEARAVRVDLGVPLSGNDIRPGKGSFDVKIEEAGSSRKVERSYAFVALPRKAASPQPSSPSTSATP